MVTPHARAAGKISIDPAGARCDRDLAPRERPRHCRRLRSVTTTDEAFSPNVNGATGVSDMAGKAARVAGEPSGSERDTTPAFSLNGADGISDIEGNAAREAESECGQRASFNRTP